MQSTPPSKFWRRFILRTPTTDSVGCTRQEFSPLIISLSIVFLSFALHSKEIGAADQVWQLNPPRSGPSAEAPTLKPCWRYFEKVRVGIRLIVVRKTPDDPGDTEEWDMSLRAAGDGGKRTFDKKSFKLEVKDNLRNAAKAYQVEQYAAFPGEVRWGGHLYVDGVESDKWPNRDDPLPGVRLNFGTGPEDGICGDRLVDVDFLSKYDLVTDPNDPAFCYKTKNGSREACYKFFARFILRPTPKL